MNQRAPLGVDEHSECPRENRVVYKYVNRHQRQQPGGLYPYSTGICRAGCSLKDPKGKGSGAFSTFRWHLTITSAHNESFRRTQRVVSAVDKGCAAVGIGVRRECFEHCVRYICVCIYLAETRGAAALRNFRRRSSMRLN